MVYYYGSHKKIYAAAAAIVIVVVAVLLVAVWYDGGPRVTTVPTSSTTFQTTVPTTVQQPQPPCNAVPGFYCANATFHNNVLELQFGQDTGQGWGTASLQFVPNGQSYVYGALVAPFPTGLGSGVNVYIGFAIPQATVANSTVDGMLEGTLYANYTVSGSTAHVVKEVARIQVAPS